MKLRAYNLCSVSVPQVSKPAVSPTSPALSGVEGQSADRPPSLRASRTHNREERGSVLIIVLWVALGLVSIALYFANSMSYELRASDNRVSGMSADQAIEGAARYVGWVLLNYATNGAMPATNLYSAEAVPIGDAHFWLIGRDPSAVNATDPAFGLVDECGKLNLNAVNTNVLSYLPNMTMDFAQAIMDWRGTNGTVSLDYSSMGYLAKNEPFESVDELRMVYDATEDLLAGDDINRNGVIDGNEKSSTGNGQPNFGLFEYTTVYTREPNFHSDGTTLTNVNTATQAVLQSLLQNAGVGNASGLATSLYRSVHPPPPATAVNNCNGILDFARRCQLYGMNEADFGKIYYNVTTTASTNLYFRNRLNVNTAGVDVLTALFMGLNIDEQTAQGAAQTLITYRGQNPNSLTTIWWIMDALGNNSPVITALAAGNYVTTRTFQFSADVAAVGPYGRGYRRVKFIFDMSEGAPIVLYRQDLSRLGWALGERAREKTLAANEAR